MKLQISVDLLSLEEAITLLDKVAPYVDVIEAGTPLIKQLGLQVVTTFKERFPDRLIYADMKTMDAGELEAEIAFKAGADFVTVLGVAADSTFMGALSAAKRFGKTVVADLVGIHDKGTRAEQLQALGVPMIALHHGLDEQAQGLTSLTEFAQVRGKTSLPFLMEGGITDKTILEAKQAGASQVAIGHFIYGASQPDKVAQQLRQEIDA